MQEKLTHITQTLEGYPIKNLLWKPSENIIVGLVKDPVRGRPTLHEGYVAVTWKSNGTLTLKYGGPKRKDLYLNLPSI
jgi:hypothetical protein